MDLIAFPTSAPVQPPPFPFKTVRPLSSVAGILSAPNGSVKLNQVGDEALRVGLEILGHRLKSQVFSNHLHAKQCAGSSCIIAAAFGPTDVRISKELPHRGVVDVLYRPKVTGSSILSQTGATDPAQFERSMEATLTQIFETTVHLEDGGRTGYNIVLHELECDGDLFSTCVNAATLALLDGGCPLRHTVAAVTLILSGDQLIIDPNLQQMKKGFSSKQVYVFSSDMSLIYTEIIGRIEPKIAKAAMELAQSSVLEIFHYYHFVVQSRFLGVPVLPKEECHMDEPTTVKNEPCSSDSEGEIHSD